MGQDGVQRAARGGQAVAATVTWPRRAGGRAATAAAAVVVLRLLLGVLLVFAAVSFALALPLIKRLARDPASWGLR